MTRFFSSKYDRLVPYTPGEQPKDAEYVKLNTNESPFAPTEKVVAAAAREAARLHLYPAPEPKALCEKFALSVGVKPEQVIATNGSDEILNFAFAAFCDDSHPAVFPDITYGFYEVFANALGVPYETIPLRDDFTISVDDYTGVGKTVFIANPNAPTGIALPLSDIERIVASNPGNVVVIDEAYVDFGARSASSLVSKYDNLLVTQTFSKSRSMAGARLGFGIASEGLIADLNTLKYSTNPYNVNRMTQAAGAAALDEPEVFAKNCGEIIKNREYLSSSLEGLGFTLTPSSANFVFAKHGAIGGERLYKELKARGVLVRHFGGERIKDFCRITVGSRRQIDVLLEKIKEIQEAIL